MKLIKLTDDHYVIVDNSEIKEGDWFLPISGIGWELNKPRQADSSGGYSNGHCTKITHSTQPVTNEVGNDGFEFDHNSTYPPTTILPLFLQEVKKLIGEVDVEKKALEISPVELDEDEFDVNETHRVTWIDGYTQAIEDNKEKKYTNEDMLTIRNQLVTMLPVGDVNAWDMIQAVSKYTKWLDEYVESIHQSPTSWDVEFDSQGKLKLK